MFAAVYYLRSAMDLKTSEPFWLVKNGILNSYPSLREDISTDILVVGGGITGSLIAHQCIKDGYDTVLIDRREVCNGSTSATTSMLQYEIDTPLYELISMIGKKGAEESYRACYKSIDDLGKVAKEVKSESGFQKKESLYCAAYKKDLEWLEKEFEARKAAGFPVQWLSAEETKKKFGISNSWGSILSEQGGSVDAFQLAHDILHYNYKKGLRIFDKTELKKVSHLKKGITAKTESGHTIKARKIIYCNGFESTEIIKEKFVDLLSTYAVVSEQLDKKTISRLQKILVWNTAEPYIYLRTTDDFRILIGGGDEDFINPEKREELLPKKIKSLENSVRKILPDIPFYTDFAWSGTFGETKDGLPYISEHEKFPSSYFVLGFGGNGITFSVIGMEMVSRFLKGKTHPLSEYFRFGR